MKLKSTFAAPLLLIAVLLLTVFTGIFEDQLMATGSSPYLTLLVIQLAVYALPALFFCRMRGKEYGKRLRFAFFPPKHFFLLIFGLLAMLSGSALLNMGMMALFPSGDFQGVSSLSLTAASGDFLQMLYILLAFAVLPALLEEFLFRGILLAEYESVGVKTAVFLSAFLFGMMHMQFLRLPAYVFTGILLALIAYATRSLFAPMLVHAAHNVAVLFLERYFYSAAAETKDTGVLLFFLLVTVLLVSLVLFTLVAQRIYAGYGEGNVESLYLSKKRKGAPSVTDALFSPPLILFVALAVIFTAVS